MRNFKKIYIVIFVLCFTTFSVSAANEKESRLSLISSNYTSKTYDLSVMTDKEGSVTKIKIKNNKKNKVKIYDLEKLKGEMTLVKAVGIKLVTLRCINFDADAGCKIRIEYPYNISYGNFKNFDATLRKVNGRWGLYNGARHFTHMRLISKKILGLLVGIKRIELHD